MNITNAKKLISQLERLPDEKFNMEDWIEHRDCGTVACIAGWCSILNGGPKDETYEDSRFFAESFLDMTASAASDLFFGHWSEKPRADITRQDAIDHLKSLLPPA